MRWIKSCVAIVVALLPSIANAQQLVPGDNAAVSFEAAYIVDGWTVLDGGIRQEQVFLHMVDVAAEADLASLVDWRGATARVQVIYNGSGSVSEPIGDAQVSSNIETGLEALRLY
jgi:carbohydrate-selective porin OprB